MEFLYLDSQCCLFTGNLLYTHLGLLKKIPYLVTLEEIKNLQRMQHHQNMLPTCKTKMESKRRKKLLQTLPTSKAEIWKENRRKRFRPWFWSSYVAILSIHNSLIFQLVCPSLCVLAQVRSFSTLWGIELFKKNLSKGLILWGKWICNHPQKDLAGFGYRS